MSEHILDSITAIQSTAGIVPEVDLLLAMAAEAQITGNLPDLGQLPSKPKCSKCDDTGLISSRNDKIQP